MTSDWCWDRPVLGVETSCDETAAAVVDDGHILSNVRYSQTEHSLYGGVVPELASRDHIRKIVPVVNQAMEDAGVGLGDLGGIAVTQGPGLVGCLLVGISYAKGLAAGSGIQLLGIHHIEGHVLAGALSDPELEPPFVALVASGGHTDIIRVANWGEYEMLGQTRDDAAGESFDKVAKMLGLLEEGQTVMGGPAVSKAADGGNPTAFDFPRGLMDSEAFDFSFSGLKTSVLYTLRDIPAEGRAGVTKDIAASFQAAVVEVLVKKTLAAAEAVGVNSVLATGGVAANGRLRATLEGSARPKGIQIWAPAVELCTDNAAMIAAVGGFRLGRGERSDSSLNAIPRMKMPGLLGLAADKGG